MTQLVVDEPLRQRLQATQDTIEFVDQDGHTLGVFCPMLSPPYDSSLVPTLTDEERRRRLAQPAKYSTNDVLQHLRSL